MRAADRPRFVLPLPLLRPLVWGVLIAWAAPMASGRSPGVNPPPKRKPVAPAPAQQGAEGAAADPGTPPASPSTPLPKPALPAIPQVSDDGPLSRSDLIQLAIQTHPDFWRFRGEVAYYLEAEAAAYDLRDPELRIGMDYEFESDLRRPYEESRSINSVERGYFDTATQSFFRTNDGSGDLEGITSGTIRENERVTQNRRIMSESVRKITPGKYQTVTDETVYEIDRRSESSRERQRGPGNARESRQSSEYERRRVLSRSREYRSHPNSVYGDTQFAITARFFLPHPWEMKARAARARAEANLSNERLRSELRELVWDVGRRYDELQFRHAWHQANLKLLKLMQQNIKQVEEASTLALSGDAAAAGVSTYDPAELPRARLEVIKAREEVFDSGRELALVKQELGAYCGLDDPSRIMLTNVLRVRKISENDLDIPSLVELARAHRPDIGEMRARGDVERARLREVKAARMPWFNDLRVGYARNTADGYRDQDELTALLTLTAPLFSPWQNKAHRQHEEAIANFEEAQRLMGNRITGQVSFATQSVREAAALLSDFARTEALLLEDLKKNEEEAKIAGARAGRIQLATDEARIKSDRGRLQAFYHYNQAVAHLELALGMPIEEAFAPLTPSAKAPADK